ncbi:MAG: GntR family transcriptional regulator [Streptosporangiaceae bacterium]
MAPDRPLTVGLTTATARAILGDVEQGGRAEQMAQRLGQAIRLGLILDGEQLPPETQLSDQLGIATVTLREVLATLREQGLVVTRRGRAGGTFARAPLDDRPGALPQRLREFSTQDIQELGDHRSAISGTSARLAAERALPGEIDSIQRQVDRLRNAITISERRRADTQFNIEVAAAAQSSRLTREELRLRAEIGDLLWLRSTDADHEDAVRSRGRLIDAIRRREAEQARELAEQYVAADTRRLLQLRLGLYEDARAEVAPHSPARTLGPPDSRELSDVLAKVTEEFESIYVALAPLSAEFATLIEGTGHATREDLASLRTVIFQVLNEQRELIAGAGVFAVPGLLADARYGYKWWWTRTSGTPEALRVNLEPAAPDFFDYVTQDWFATPMLTSARHVAGPYVDYACTSQNSLTVAAPVRARGELVGVAAADVLVSRLETRILPSLCRLAQPTALVNAQGRVVASSSPYFAPGQQIAGGTSATLAQPGGRAEGSSTFGWHLVSIT